MTDDDYESVAEHAFALPHNKPVTARSAPFGAPCPGTKGRHAPQSPTVFASDSAGRGACRSASPGGAVAGLGPSAHAALHIAGANYECEAAVVMTRTELYGRYLDYTVYKRFGSAPSGVQ